MTVRDVWDWLDRFAPFESQEEYDNVGLLMGDPSAEVTRVLFALDATLPVVREAQAQGAQLIVTHHPLMFGGISRIRYDEPEGAVLAAIAGARLSLIAAHTNLDRATGGTGDSLAAALALTGVGLAGKSLYARVGTLPVPCAADDLLARVDHQLGSHARLYGNPALSVSRVAVAPGAAGEEYTAASQAGAQVFIVGEIKHHQLLAAQALGLAVIEAGHYYTELPGIVALYHRFAEDALSASWSVEAHLSDISPFDCAVAPSGG